MTAIRHQKTAGALLFVFGLLELLVLVYTVEKVAELQGELSGGLKTAFLGATIAGITLSLALFVVQLIGGYCLMKGSKRAWGWGIAASVIAISTLWGAPAGIYAIWARLKYDKEDRNNIYGK